MEEIPMPPSPERLMAQTSIIKLIPISKNFDLRSKIGLKNIARRTLGIALLFATVILWTSSNFLASFIFADDSYSKAYFVTYINTSFFALSLIPIFLKSVYQHGIPLIKATAIEYWHIWRNGHKSTRLDSSAEREEDEEDEEEEYEEESLMLASHSNSATIDQSNHSLRIPGESRPSKDKLNLLETAKLSFEFCILWFVANYLAAACLQYTSVASSTILSSTSSIWTLIFGSLARVEHFSLRKLFGVVASLAGVILISTVDLFTNDNDKNRGTFPHKSQSEIAIGDAMAFCSAIMYGIYAIVMKKRIENENRVNMPLFFGLVGLFNVLFLWPGFLVLHITGIETFQLPPNGHIWTVILLNSTFSFVSDFCWAYAMLLTSPLVITVGLSMSIPFSLVGQMIISSQYSSGLYWAGAFIVFLSFLIVNHETKDETDS